MLAPPRGLPFAFLLGAGAVVGCNTGAVAIQQCREIEYERCEASVPCELGNISTDDDVAACKRFYKNQCLHGIAGDEVPTAKAQKDCVDTIKAAAVCAAKNQDGLAESCDGVEATTSINAEGGRVKTVCDVVGRPWDLAVCDYLLPSGAGGSSG
jgi:hypothetical protein